MYAYRSKKALAFRRATLKKQQKQIRITIAAIFICINIGLATIFWPMIIKHRAAIERGDKKPIIEIRLLNDSR